MAQSIKLNNNLYWDTSSLHGGAIFNKVGDNLNANTPRTVTFPNNYRGILFIGRSNDTAQSMYMVCCTSTGGVYCQPIVAGSGVSYTKGVNTMTITTTTTGYLYAIGTHVLA